MNTIAPFALPFSLMAKPASARCNLACTYCYYLEAARRQAERPATTPTSTKAKVRNMLGEDFVRDYIQSQPAPEVTFVWHGGEPLLCGIEYYEQMLRWQRQYADGRTIHNSLQTNGTLLDDQWGRFLAENQFLVGISIDGPQHLHDAYRRNRAGQPSFAAVMRGLDCLIRNGVEWNVLATVNHVNVSHPRLFYDFFRAIGCQYLQFTPVVERTAGTAAVTPESVRPEEWGPFLCEVFDLWAARDIGHVFVQYFESTLANWLHLPPGLCALGRSCSNGAIVEADGTIYACDHFAFPEYRLGNLRQAPLAVIIHSPRHQQFARQKIDGLTQQCRECRWCFACHGECPRNRFAQDCYGHPGHNYLCKGYRQFFRHAAPTLNRLAADIAAQRNLR